MAVYTEVSDEALAAFLACYDIGSLVSYKGIAEGVENTNYLVDTDRGRFILTLYERRVAEADLPFFLGLMEHLAGHGVGCPLPVRDRDGVALRRLAGRPAALVTFLDGVWIRRPRPEHCEAVGMALAGLHAAGRSFAIRRANALGPHGWSPLFDRFAAQADSIADGLGGIIAGELATLLPAWPETLPSGVIHADLFPDNVFFLGDRLSGLIDFYFACNDFLAYDLAVSLNAWCFEPDGRFEPARGAALLAGYQQRRRLQQDEVAALPLLARGAALRFLLTRSYDWLNTPKDALVRPHDPIEYLRKLRFHQSATDAGAYGLS